MLGAWFSFKHDGLALIESVASFRKSGGTHIAIFDDSCNPIDSEIIDQIKPDIYEQTTWNRNKNLRGWDCVFGMLNCLQNACEQLNQTQIVKIDSDTLILSLDWINQQAPMTGFMFGKNAYFLGLTYHLQLDSIKTIKNSLNSRWRDESFLAPEDMTISAEAFWKFGSQICVHSCENAIAAAWNYRKMNINSYSNCQVLSFGNRHLINNCDSDEEKRKFAALQMKKFPAFRELMFQKLQNK